MKFNLILAALLVVTPVAFADDPWLESAQEKVAQFESEPSADEQPVATEDLKASCDCGPLCACGPLCDCKAAECLKATVPVVEDEPVLEMANNFEAEEIRQLAEEVRREALRMRQDASEVRRIASELKELAESESVARSSAAAEQASHGVDQSAMAFLDADVKANASAIEDLQSRVSKVEEDVATLIAIRNTDEPDSEIRYESVQTSVGPLKIPLRPGESVVSVDGVPVNQTKQYVQRSTGTPVTVWSTPAIDVATTPSGLAEARVRRPVAPRPVFRYPFGAAPSTSGSGCYTNPLTGRTTCPGN